MRYIFIFLFFIVSLPSYAFSLRADAPASYTVQQGDSLWEIATRYLERPWEWKQLWRANPKIKNPNRIYPGTVIELDYNNSNKPYLRVLSNGTVKLSPHMRAKSIDNSIPPIPLSDIRPFLNPSLVLDHDFLQRAPYIVAYTNEHLLGGQGDEVYVQDLCPNPNLPLGVNSSYSVFRQGGEYFDPKTKRLLGYKAILVGYADLVQPTNPAKVVLTDIMQGVRIGDRVMPNSRTYFDLYFEPKAPSVRVNASIIDLPGDYTQGAAGLVAVIDRGKDIGLEPGDVLAVYGPGRAVSNPECGPRCIAIPPERIGEVMVFRTFTHTSFALVVRATRSVKKRYSLTNP